MTSAGAIVQRRTTASLTRTAGRGARSAGKTARNRSRPRSRIGRLATTQAPRKICSHPNSRQGRRVRSATRPPHRAPPAIPSRKTASTLLNTTAVEPKRKEIFRSQRTWHESESRLVKKTVPNSRTLPPGADTGETVGREPLFMRPGVYQFPRKGRRRGGGAYGVLTNWGRRGQRAFHRDRRIGRQSCLHALNFPLKETTMCRNIKPLFNFEPPVTDNEIRNASLQFVRKISGFTKPSQANEEAFETAVEQISEAAHTLLASLVTNGSPRNREGEAAKARVKAARRDAPAGAAGART